MMMKAMLQLNVDINNCRIMQTLRHRNAISHNVGTCDLLNQKIFFLCPSHVFVIRCCACISCRLLEVVL